ncbi:uncharacterized protein [Haliotis asinina]|uniref:uncharacterized protein n=1 Tax=Haliotis asinina TaxID=109174 RepID=UPI0035320B26
MGKGYSRNFHGEVISCGDYIGHSDVSNYIQTRDMPKQDRKMLQGCYDLFESKPDFVWRNCAIEVMCPSLSVKFVSGDERNRYIIRLKDDDTWTVPMREEIRTKLYDTYEWLRSHLKGMGDAIAGHIKDNPEKVLSIGFSALKLKK